MTSEAICEHFERQTGINLRLDGIAMARIGAALERHSPEIEATGACVIYEPYISASPSGPVHLNLRVSMQASGGLIIEDIAATPKGQSLLGPLVIPLLTLAIIGVIGFWLIGSVA